MFVSSGSPFLARFLFLALFSALLPHFAWGAGDSAMADLPTVRFSPRIRAQVWDPRALTALRTEVLEPFWSEALVVDAQDMNHAPRVVATAEHHVMLSRGDRAYALGTDTQPLDQTAVRVKPLWRLFRNARPLKDPVTQQVLGYEAHYLGKAVLQQSESQTFEAGPDGRMLAVTVPARIEIVNSKEEVRVGDRLLPEPERTYLNMVPRSPDRAVEGRIVSMYGSAVVNAGQNQVVSLNLGRRDGLKAGHVLNILKAGAQLQAQPDNPTLMKLPDEPNGWLLVFQTFEQLSYGLVLDTVDGVRVGDRLVGDPHARSRVN